MKRQPQKEDTALEEEWGFHQTCQMASRMARDPSGGSGSSRAVFENQEV